ncbi:MAG: hypothetical protein RI897_4504 [Verrucomicrobiota bacterium]
MGVGEWAASVIGEGIDREELLAGAEVSGELADDAAAGFTGFGDGDFDDVAGALGQVGDGVGGGERGGWVGGGEGFSGVVIAFCAEEDVPEGLVGAGLLEEG